MEDYTTEQLEKIFKIHANDFVKIFNEQKEKYETDYKSDYPFEDFNLCEALHVICREINQLKREIKYGKTYQRFKSGDA